VGYDEEVTSSPGIKEFVENWGAGSRNPYVKLENLYGFCKAFNLEPFELTNITKEEIVIENGIIGAIANVSQWLTIWEAKPKIFYNKVTTDSITFLDGALPGNGVPICILSNSKINNVQARMLLD
ncbi:hypothetical protein, partial [Vibrio furnissii]|uniref:hypothetical protein n=1 Tax=Vibrio furnissii TaxID=29494 RepID=UPI001EEA94E1